MSDSTPSRSHASRRGFTLVEMLVAVALVVLMMSMFATVFQLATGAMSKQKGLAENDQRARLAQTMLQADLQKRTFRKVLPLKRGEEPPFPDLQQGYFYISENDPNDDTDDVIQFSMIIKEYPRSKDLTPLYGRSVPLKHSSSGSSVNQYALSNPNQPELDDGQVDINNSATSNVGEVCYFLRNGILYRRVMLVRTPFIGDNPTPTGFDNMGNANQDLIDAPYRPDPMSGNPPLYAPSGSGRFWRDFDYSAFNPSVITGNPSNNFPAFLGATETDNALNNVWDPGVSSLSTVIKSLGMPNMRWGFNQATTTASVFGRPREYVTQARPTASASDVAGEFFIGRFTHEETSHDDFLYPGHSSATNTPFTDNSFSLIQDQGVIRQLLGGPRRGEDIVLTNVHAFDIKVFDDGVFNFVDIGNSTGNGFYCSAANKDGRHYGPHSSGNSNNNVFDTWHPNFDSDGDGQWDTNSDGIADEDFPPFRADSATPDGNDQGYGPDKKPGVANFNDDGDVDAMGNPIIDEADEQGWPGSDDNRPLRSIQIHIRYYDTTSDQMRDLTIIQSLID